MTIVLWLNLTTTSLGSLRNNRHVLVPFAAAVTTKHCENVAVISSNSNILYLMPTGSLRILYRLFRQGYIEKTRDLPHSRFF